LIICNKIPISIWYFVSVCIAVTQLDPQSTLIAGTWRWEREDVENFKTGAHKQSRLFLGILRNNWK